MVAESTRKRAKHTRSKRGCTVCRIRRIRCDETRPACQKCTSTGRTCEGFPARLRWNTYSSTQLMRPRTTTAEGSVEERSFTYFRVNTAAQFAAPFGNEFWTCLVLQIGEREQCVKQAIVALGALHESFTDEHVFPPSPLPSHLLHRPSWQVANLATASYTRALRGLNDYILPTTYEGLHISLLCCILFTSFESLRGSYTAATTHLKSGLHILRQWSSTATSMSTPTAHLIRHQLAPMFVRLAIQARTFTADMVPMPWLSSDLFVPPDKAEGEEQHLRAARTAIDVLCGEVYLHPSSLSSLSMDCMFSDACAFDFSVRLANWCAEYHMHLLPQPSPAQEEAPRPENVSLTLWYTVLSLLQGTKNTRDPMAYDEYMPQFGRMNYLARFLVWSNGSPELLPRASLDTPRFRIDMEIVPMLYLVASHCRHPVLRRESIALLRSGASREGLWDGWAVARLAEEIVAVEEEGLEVGGTESVPAGRRVCKLVEETDLETRTMRVKFQRWGEKDYEKWRTLKW